MLKREDDIDKWELHRIKRLIRKTERCIAKHVDSEGEAPQSLYILLNLLYSEQLEYDLSGISLYYTLESVQIAVARLRLLAFNLRKVNPTAAKIAYKIAYNLKTWKHE